jgi:integrase
VNFWRVENPARDVSFYDEKERERFLSPSELVRLNSLLAKESHQILADFLVLAINTGARKSDVLAMRWADIQWEREIWRVPFPKGGEAYDVALLPAAVEVLSRRRSEAADSAEFVFPSATAKSGHVEDVKKQWQAFRAKAKILDVRIHDLRRTCGSFIAMSGGSEVQIAAALGHRSLQSVKVYARLNDENVRQAREVGHQKMIELMALAEERAKAKPPQLPEVVGRKLGRP